jgi:phosphopantothenoylcysteine synthetase/decarboxylase
MVDQFTVPEEYEISFRRIMPYLMSPLQRNPQILESLLLYLKLGGEKMARIAIDAMNVTQRLQNAELKKLLREQELLNDNGRDDEDDEDDDDDESEDDDRGEDDAVADDDAPDDDDASD